MATQFNYQNHLNSLNMKNNKNNNNSSQLLTTMNKSLMSTR